MRQLEERLGVRLLHRTPRSEPPMPANVCSTSLSAAITLVGIELMHMIRKGQSECRNGVRRNNSIRLRDNPIRVERVSSIPSGTLRQNR